jgi:hypothetical protein
MTPEEIDRLEKLSAELESGKRVSIFYLLDLFRRAFPDRPASEIHAMAKAALAATDYVN